MGRTWELLDSHESFLTSQRRDKPEQRKREKKKKTTVIAHPGAQRSKPTRQPKGLSPSGNDVALTVHMLLGAAAPRDANCLGFGIKPLQVPPPSRGVVGVAVEPVIFSGGC